VANWQLGMGMEFTFTHFKSKLSVTCDVWTSKNQLSFFGFTIHYIDDDWQMQQELLAFKYLRGEHEGQKLVSGYY
jgi:hypothetical protein